MSDIRKLQGVKQVLTIRKFQRSAKAIDVYEAQDLEEDSVRALDNSTDELTEAYTNWNQLMNGDEILLDYIPLTFSDVKEKEYLYVAAKEKLKHAKSKTENEILQWREFHAGENQLIKLAGTIRRRIAKQRVEKLQTVVEERVSYLQAQLGEARHD